MGPNLYPQGIQVIPDLMLLRVLCYRQVYSLRYESLSSVCPPRVHGRPGKLLPGCVTSQRSRVWTQSGSPGRQETRMAMGMGVAV